METLLSQELETYGRHQAELLGSAEGKFVLIRGGEVVGVYEAKQDALREGYERFGNVPFLVKQVVKVEVPQNFVSNLLGV